MSTPLALPKPEKRQPAPRRPLPRPTRPLSRSAKRPARRKKVRKLSARDVPKLKRKLWVLLREYVRAAWGATCFTCDKTELQGSDWHTAHFVNAGKSAAARFDPDNLRPCCYRCNVGLKGNLAEFSIRLLDQIGEAKFRALLARSRRSYKWTAPDLVELIEAIRRGPAAYECAFYSRFMP